jgi:outer membrane protein OmpA-like peptidoglycan-associated protein
MYLSGFLGFSFTFFNSKDSDGDGVPDDKDLCPDTPSGIRVDLNGCPLDSDHDGVPDYLDECPGTPEGVKVNKKGCPLDSDGDGVPDYLDLCPGTPAGVAVDENGCPKDSDGDGVPDYLDKCPNTPKGAPIDQYGCPLDSDGDGVPDYLDKCPNTPKGVQVDSVGCPLQLPQVIKEVPVIKEVAIEKQVVLSAGALFQMGKANLLPAAFPDLDKLVASMKETPKSKWIIEGHTDNIGAPANNKKLSLARAQAVLKYFTSKGLNKDRFTVRGLGADFPVTTNATEEGRLKNRRVVIIRVN